MARLTFLLALLLPINSWAEQALTVHGEPKYKADFKHFDYVNPNAPKGGTLTLGWMGAFDKINPYSTKGITPVLLGSLVFQTLGEGSLDEEFTMYPQLAKSFKVSEDKLSMKVTLNSEAEFSDGHPVTTEDVKFSFDLFKSNKVDAFYKSYWADIEKIKVKNSHTFTFVFSRVNPELPLISLQLPILPAHFYEQGDFGKDYADKALASGPYVVDEFKRGSFIRFKRNPKYWGWKLPTMQGRYNFDEILVRYYRDETTLVEALKKGSIDMYVCYHAKTWATGLNGDKFSKLSWIDKQEWQHENNQGTQAWFFNLSDPLFKDRNLRKAIALAFDFEWTNRTLFFGQYKKNQSFFENSVFKARGKPNSQELELLKELDKKYPGELSEDIFVEEAGSLGKGLSLKARLKAAATLLKNSGYKVENEVLQGPAGPVQFNFLLSSPSFARVLEPFISNLERLGIKVEIEIKDPSVYQQRLLERKYQVTTVRIGQSLSLGNEQKDYWTSAAAEQKYSRNYALLKSKLVDDLVDRLIYAQTKEQSIFYARVLDRVLYNHHFVIHNWHIDFHRVAIWNKFNRPKISPRFFSPLQYKEYMWSDAAKKHALENAQKKNLPLNG